MYMDDIPDTLRKTVGIVLTTGHAYAQKMKAYIYMNHLTSQPQLQRG